mmetsp:Transcript_17014/g.12074  ORF Transcript_17014/g.12074 Transcript_17014/m.12074 type:complete len:131 (+) Transcript_17014:755-1147(+)
MDPVENAGDRIAQATTIFLTVIAFQLYVSTLLPKLSYLTLIDKYVAFCILFIAIVLIEIGSLTFVATRYQTLKDEVIQRDNRIFLVNFVILLLANLIFLLSAIIGNNKSNTRLHMNVAETLKFIHETEGE